MAAPAWKASTPLPNPLQFFHSQTDEDTREGMDMHKFLLLNRLCHDAVGEAPGIRVRFTQAWQNENLLVWKPHSYSYTRGIICTSQTRVRGLKYEHPIYLEESDPLQGLVWWAMMNH